MRKTIKGTHYEVDKKGNVYSKDRIDTSGRHRKELKLKSMITDRGYLTVVIYKLGKPKREKIHRLVALAFIPNPENKPDVNHIDGDKTNNCVENLEWVTKSQNIKHGFEIGLFNSVLRKERNEKGQFVKNKI